MNRTASILVGIAAAATLTLTGCSGSTTEGPAAPPAQTQAAESPAPSTEPSASTEASASASSEPSATEDSSDGDSSEKPSKDDIVKGLTKFYRQNQSISEDKATKFAVCMVDEMYDKADAKTLAAMRDGDPTKIDPDDATLFGTAGGACAPALQ